MLLVTILLMAIVVPAALWVLLSLSSVQDIVRKRAEKELTALLGTPVGIGRVNIAPFNSVTLHDVTIRDDNGAEALNVERLGAGIELGRLVLSRDIVVSYVELVGLHADLYRDSVNAPLNIQPIVDRLVKKKPGAPPSSFDLAVNIVVIRKSTVDYNVKDMPGAAAGQFSPYHISVVDLRADVTLPRVSNNRSVIDLKRLAFAERSGLTVESLSVIAEITPESVSVRNFRLALPGTALSLSDVNVRHGGMSMLRDKWKTLPLRVSLLSGSYLTPSDFGAFLPILNKIDNRLDMSFDIAGTPSDFEVADLKLALPSLPLSMMLDARVTGATEGPANATVAIPSLNIKANAAALPGLLKKFMTPSQALLKLLTGLNAVEIDGHAEFEASAALLAADVTSAAGNLSLEAKLDRRKRSLDADLSSARLDFSAVMPNLPLSVESVEVEAKGLSAGTPFPDGHIAVNATGLALRNIVLDNISADMTAAAGDVKAVATADGPVGTFDIDAAAALGSGDKSLIADISLGEVNLEALGVKLPGKLRHHNLTADIAADLTGTDADDVRGSIDVNNILLGGAGDGLRPGPIVLTASADSLGRQITLRSDVINGNVGGNFRFATLASSVKTILAGINPEFFPAGVAEADAHADDLSFNFSIEPDNPLISFFNLPLKPLTPVTVSGGIDDVTRQIDLVVSAPYIQQKDKLIEQTSLSLTLDGLLRRSSMQFYTLFPAKGTQVGLTVFSDGVDGIHNTGIKWINASGHNHGDLRFTTAFRRTATEDGTDNGVETSVSVNPGRIVFNDTVWHVHPSTVDIAGGEVSVNNFKVTHAGQMLGIDGIASRDSTARLELTLRDINLDYVFETLNIPNVMFGGDATGVFYASSLMGGAPVLFTPDLHVRNLAYNHCVMGDGVIKSAWHPDTQSVTIDATINQEDGSRSFINGSINPGKELLDFRFDANHANVGFLKPFMAAFCDSITGKASGKAHLFGTFKLLDMEGDLYAENLRMTLGITGTTYSATDSVHIRPGRIELDDILLSDARGKTAVLSGLLTHSSFKEPRFNFNVSGARDFLCYDVPPNTEHPWYGKIYGNGSVSITGRPGLVDIGVEMSTAPGSEFTFVLSDEEVAAEYDFLTFRDAGPVTADTADEVSGAIPAIVNALRNKVKQSTADKPTDYLMTFNVDVTPDARIILVMDPVGGDRIRATGSGNLRMSYGSANDELKMYGTYTLNRGFYNFTLQDIIIKDFTIEDGSSIAFHGDPYSALLNIRAYYALNANLSDLDESFLQDRELNRTNVPVHAMLLVNGDMRRPDISFDLEFPTLTQDTYRKVRSIVSTDDMMNRQIIYLLALNRFYTPEYMSATRGNELVSVASSTISSQLGSMLGQLSDKFSIAPSFRSDRGDFSDVEVDVALSSHLLNNRLLLNGTFGYRDKSLNDNSFIGDFDIEYLLNRSGSLRLKAYNRYNDQNYYLKSALTTQGVGIVYKRDFDNLFDFWHRLRRKWKNRGSNSVATDTLVVTPSVNNNTPSDTIPSIE